MPELERGVRHGREVGSPRLAQDPVASERRLWEGDGGEGTDPGERRRQYEMKWCAKHGEEKELV